MAHPLGHTVLITGGAGFLARGIYHRALREQWDCDFTALSRDDAKHARLQQAWPGVGTIPWDVRASDERLVYLMRGFDTVIHAAASKYVDRAETNAMDTIETNVQGSVNVAMAAMEAGVSTVIGISTDKAVEPRNVYGATKMVMERAYSDLAPLGMPDTRILSVRYGNVIGSTGSVVPLFRRQLAETGRITVTDPRMTRFWMSIEEAVDTILHAAVSGYPGDVVVPTPKALPMADVVRAVLGFESREPLPVEKMDTIGLRPGEKMHESLMHDAESIRVEERSDEKGRVFYHIRAPGIPVDPPHEAQTIRSDEPPGGLWGIEDFRREFMAAEEV